MLVDKQVREGLWDLTLWHFSPICVGAQSGGRLMGVLSHPAAGGLQQPLSHWYD